MGEQIKPAREEFLWPPVGSRAAYVQHEEMCDLIDRLRANQRPATGYDEVTDCLICPQLATDRDDALREVEALRANQVTPEAQAVPDRAGLAVAYHQACLSLAAGPSLPDYADAWDLFLAAMADLADANAARRGAAGGVL